MTLHLSHHSIVEAQSDGKVPNFSSLEVVKAFQSLKANSWYPLPGSKRIYTGQVPFARFTRDLQIKARILAGQRPERPVDSSDSWSIWGLTEDMWALMEDCWQHVPEERPTIQEVLDRL
ncbi:hypothetical protein C0992_001402 [Termitomyces sp. T32_za158]|nr:hypothetical protein C0992_001402 [Termitomyces sp. T32_za158]